MWVWTRLFYVIAARPATGRCCGDSWRRGSPLLPVENMDPDIYEYVIDANDVITNVNDSWESFAEENGSEGLGERVVGSWLWQHLAGVEVKHLFRVLLERVRTTGKVVRVPFRCDAPDLRRHMILEVTPLPDDVVRFSSWV